MLMDTIHVMAAFRNQDIEILRQRIVGSRQIEKPEPTTVFTFDSKTTLTLEEARHNVLILGGTGRGKTVSFVTPITARLVKMGLGGLIIDVKNTQCDNIRKIAAKCGRLDDIVEVGSFATARPVNLLAGMDEQERIDMLENLMITGIRGSHNLDWHYKGVCIVQDCLRLLQYLDEAHPGGQFRPTLSLLAKMASDFEFSRNLWQHWIWMVNETTPEQATFRASVESNSFHVLCKENSTGSEAYEWERQVTWQLANVRKILNDLSSSQLSCKLSDSSGLALNLDELILKRKSIVILRFSPRTGKPGRIVARYLKERFYQSVYSRYEHPCAEQEPVFCILDEFQDVLNLDEDSSLDDFNWLSKAREFNVINVAATQSMSSLYRTGLEHKVHAMLGNFGTKILMQSDDPATDAWARTFFEAPKPVQKLCKGEVILAKYALPSRQLEVTGESVQESHDRMVSSLCAMAMPEITPFPNGMDQTQFIREKIWKPDWVLDDPDLIKLYARFDEYVRDVKIDVHATDFKKKSIIAVMEILLEQLQDSGIVLKRLEWSKRDRYVITTQTRQKEAEEKAKALFSRVCETCGKLTDTELIRHSLKTRCAECEIDMLRGRMKEHLIDFFETYQRNLRTPFVEFSFPKGWSKIVEGAMTELLKISDTIMVNGIYEKNNFLFIMVCKTTIPFNMEKTVMRIAKHSGSICKQTCRDCGASLTEQQGKKSLCEACDSKVSTFFNEV
ncbi:MAG: hypothetical protein EA399_17715 [Desulfovibrionales bacterium]|nr:MAG: hypothetical protein EA399_17715 [Desulfovibrionales bacterium]